MAIRIVDNKKLDMTDDEMRLYETICRSYDDINFKGSELFKGLFETNDDGIIVFLRPPSTRKTSLEVYLFLMNLTMHQHLRSMHRQIDDICTQVTDKLKTLK